jgi:hypothetical protein
VVQASITGTAEHFRTLTDPSERFETYRRSSVPRYQGEDDAQSKFVDPPQYYGASREADQGRDVCFSRQKAPVAIPPAEDS